MVLSVEVLYQKHDMQYDVRKKKNKLLRSWEVILVFLYMTKYAIRTDRLNSEPEAYEKHFNPELSGLWAAFYRRLWIGNGMGALVPVRTCAFGGKHD